MAGANQLGAKCAYRVEASEIGKLLVVNRKVNVQTALGRGGDTFIQTGVEIDHRVDAEVGER